MGTGIVTVIVIVTKFDHGAWIVIVSVPVIVSAFYAVRRHYDDVRRRLSTRLVSADQAPRNRVVLYVPDDGPATNRALGYVRSLDPEGFRAVHVETDGDAADLREWWNVVGPVHVPLEVAPAGRTPVDAFVSFLRTIPRDEGELATVVIPEAFTKPSLAAALRGPMFQLKVRLLAEPQTVVTDVPLLRAPGAGPDAGVLLPHRREALVFISGVHDGTVRAVNYARSMRADEVRAVFFAFEPDDIEPVWRGWLERRIPVELEMADAPFRDLGPPVLETVRRATAREGTIADVIVPELIMAKRRHEFLHNHRALFIKRLLLFEPNVVLSSVPFRIGDDAAGL